MKPVFIFSGTTEGRNLAEEAARAGIACTVSVATAYGEMVMESREEITVREGRMNAAQMAEAFREKEYAYVIDATHPYAVEVTAQIKEACGITGVPYLRLRRETDECELFTTEKCEQAENAAKAAELLNSTQGNVLLTTGSKELHVFAERIEDKSRLYARVLPNRDSLDICESCGITGKQIIAMQGPFTEELNEAIIKQFDISVMVSKESGKSGGFMEKVRAAQKQHCRMILIRNPEKGSQEKSYTFEEIRKLLTGRTPKRRLTLAGIGMGTDKTMTKEVREAIDKAQIVFGAPRVLQSLPPGRQMPYYRKEEILPYLEQHPEYEEAVVAFSGDTGFYSGASSFRDIEGYEVRTLCGISSVVYFASRLGRSWQDMTLLSAHGRTCNIIGHVRKEACCFLLMTDLEALQRLGRELYAQFGASVQVTYGYQLSYPEEEIGCGTAELLTGLTGKGLYVLLIDNRSPMPEAVTPGLGDEAFLRAKAPMTKEEIREVSLCKLRLTRDAVVYDIGAGTGSVSVECALLCEKGQVYALEKEAETVSLLQKNKEKFGLPNLHVIQAEAPEGLEDLPSPTHVFIGGSGGNLEEIVNRVLDKNPAVRVVINAVTLETLSEASGLLEKLRTEESDIVQVAVNKAKKAGRYHMMTAANPVYIISFTGKI